MTEQYIWSYLKQRGLSDCGTAGLMGNLFAESGLNPKNLQHTYEKKLSMSDAEYTAGIDNGTYPNFVHDAAGYGLAQWTYWSRKQNLLNYAKQTGRSIGDLTMQLEFLFTELESGYKNLLQILKSTDSVLEASNAVLFQFERPANQSLEVQNKRASYGQEYYSKFAGVPQQPVIENTLMKYNANNKPITCFQTNSTCYQGTSLMTPVGVLWHSTGANNPTLKRYVQPLETDTNYAEMIELLGKNVNSNDWNHIYREAGLNAWIGKLANGSVSTIQTMPWDFMPWGCGAGSKGSCNNGWIQFEICEDGLTDPDYFNAVYKEACELTAYLCKMFNIDPFGTITRNGVNVPTILCHADSYKLGFGGNHGDVLHWFPKHGKTMDDVRKDVYDLMSASTVLTTPEIIIPESNTPNIEEDEDMTVERFEELWHEMRSSKLQDNESSTWSAEARQWAVGTGLIQGGNLTPDGKPNYMWEDMLTREQFVTVLYRFAQMMGKV